MPDADKTDPGARDLVKIQRALVSVFDKALLRELVENLFDINSSLEMLSSRGTATTIREYGCPVMEIAEYTGFPESPGGLLKTLHPRVHGGILLDPEDPEQKAYMGTNGITPIDLVVVNLYPFEDVVRKDADLETARENIDIGGHAMIRAAAKNYRRVAVLIHPNIYLSFLDKVRKLDGHTNLETRFSLAQHAFRRAASYDIAIDYHLGSKNPQIAAAFYADREKLRG